MRQAYDDFENQSCIINITKQRDSSKSLSKSMSRSPGPRKSSKNKSFSKGPEMLMMGNF